MKKESFIAEFESIKNECCDYLINQSYFDFSDSLEKINEEVDPLLMFEKPKVMVYGIYNAGKSTLINALCKKEVAQMADIPTTARIDEYEPVDSDYILIDSPGVDAPIEHEKITEENLSKCHVILFVMSSKGIFEDKSNYIRMIELIDKKIPFLIILNDRGYTILQSDSEEVRESKKREHELEIMKIKHKIIENLRKYSKSDNISNLYEIIDLNAKRALKGVLTGKEKLYKTSNVGQLDDRIRQLLSGEKQLHVFRQPLNNMLDILGEITSELYKQRTGINQVGFEESVQTMLKMKNNVMESMRIYTKQIVYGHSEELARIIRSGDENGFQELKKYILDEIETHYVARVNELANYINAQFSEYGISVDGKVSFNNRIKENNESSDKFIMPKKIEGNDVKQPDFEIKNIQSSADSSSLGDLLKNLFKSKSKKEEEQYNRMLIEAEAENERSRHWMEEQVRVLQESRQEALKLLDQLQRTLVIQVNYVLTQKFDEIIDQIRLKGEIESENSNKIDEMISVIKDYEMRFNVLADRIL